MLQDAFNIGEVTIAVAGKPYVIAEIGSNHDQSIDKAFNMIDLAAQAGADAVKFQLFKADKMYPAGTKMHDIFKSIELNSGWLSKLAEYSRKVGVQFMASPFDEESASFLEDIGVNAYKVASSEITNPGFLSHIASFNKPMFISTGMCDLVDVYDAVESCKHVGNTQIALLQCGAMYPIPVEHVNLRVMDTFSSLFGCPVGFSDHTRGMAAAVAAVGRGACVIEKHITLDRDSSGPDHFFAMEPKEFKTFIQMINDAYNCLGIPEKKMLPEERVQGRREGIYAANDIAEGDIFGENNIIIQRPAGGIRKRHYQTVLGSISKRAFAKGDALEWDSIVLK
jgi:sialic acid synthase SpsE